jgi:hypothetical protein
MVIVPKADHKIAGHYQKELLKIVTEEKHETVRETP